MASEGLPTSHSQAKAIGASRYFTGKPCKSGHIAERYVSGRCVECDKQIYLANQAARIEKQAKWRESNREAHRAYSRKWTAENQERCRQRYEANKEDRRAYAIAWAKANPEKRRANEAARRARVNGAEGRYTEADIDRIWKAQKCKCAICKVKLKRDELEVDHITPLTKGGSNRPSNLQALCKSCNASKGAKDPIDFARYLGMLV